MKYKILMAVCILCMIAGSAFNLYRKYRVYNMTLRDIRGLFEEEPYVYEDVQTGKKVERQEPVRFFNCRPGEEALVDAGYASCPVRVRFRAQYTNGTLYPDGSQEEYDPPYVYRSGDACWYRDYPYRYRDREPGKQYRAVLSERVSIEYTAEYADGYLYPDGSQEELH